MPAFTSLRAFLAASNLGGAGFNLSDEIILNSATSSYIWIAFDPNTEGNFVASWREGSNAKAKLGQVSGTSVTFGSATTFETNANGETHVEFDPTTANRFFVGWSNGTLHNSGTPKCAIGTVSGTSISFGSSISMPAGPGHPNSTWAAAQRAWCWDRTGTYIFYAAYDQSSANQGRCHRITTSGTSLSSWTYIGEMDGNGRNHYLTTNLGADNSAVVSYSSNDANGRCRVLTGTSMGSYYDYVSNQHSYFAALRFLPNSTSKFVVAYGDEGDSTYGKVKVGTVSGSSITYGTAYTFASYAIGEPHIDFAQDTDNTFAVVWSKVGDSYSAKGALCTVNTSTDVITIGDEEAITGGEGGVHALRVSFDPSNDSFITAYRDNSSGAEQYYGKVVVGGI